MYVVNHQAYFFFMCERRVPFQMIPGSTVQNKIIPTENYNIQAGYFRGNFILTFTLHSWDQKNFPIIKQVLLYWILSLFAITGDDTCTMEIQAK